MKSNLFFARAGRALGLSLALSVLFMVATAYTSAATLLTRVESTDVMQAASDGAWSGKILWQMWWFATAQLLLHAGLAVVAWLLALCTSVLTDALRSKICTLVVGWFCLLCGATLAFNALWYPRTLMGAYYHDTVAAFVGPLHVGQWFYYGVTALAVVTAVLAARRAGGFRQPAMRYVGSAALVALALYVVYNGADEVTPAAASPAGDRKPNVIILGIDSLRLDQLERFGGRDAVMPNLDRFLADADVFVDTTTPAARTFSSWVAILTGRSPPVTGARFNLAPRHSVAANPTIGDVLRSHDFRTVYSTDEVRFANIDASYGFDQVITPPIGASDFLIGTYNELPLASVFINTRLGQWLFPFSYGNRGVANMFEPATFLGRLDRELSFELPTVFIAHLTASHWPYYTAETPFGVSAQKAEHDRPMYRIGLRTVDGMFGQVLDVLRRKGALDNALVIVLSDHGEALGLPNDTFFRTDSIVEGLGAPLQTLDLGHGQSVLSPTQYKVLLGFKSFGTEAGFESKGRTIAFPATVEDIAPTILALLGEQPDVLSPDGVSLASILRGERPVNAGSESAERIRFTETDLAVLPAPDGSVDEVATAKKNSVFFELDPENARLQLRRDYGPLALAYKERAAFTTRHLLAAIPAGPDAHQYLFFDLQSGSGQLLLKPPDASRPEARRLWDAMHCYYGNELRPATRTTIEDWPRIDQEWLDFFKTRNKSIQNRYVPTSCLRL